MKDKKDPQLTADEALSAENELLKMKLKLEHGMDGMEADHLPPAVQNEWLKNICAFEEQYKNAKRTTVYDFLDRPSFQKAETLTDDEIGLELERIQSIMAKNNVELDCLASYDSATIYRFITEELFAHEMDDIRIPGMVTHFIYEEFHPNHEYDVKQNGETFVTSILSRAWSPEFDEHRLASNVGYGGKEYERGVISSIIITFQDINGHFDVEHFNIEEAIVDVEAGVAQVRAQFSAVSRQRAGDHIDGSCNLHFTYDHEFWKVSGFDLPWL